MNNTNIPNIVTSEETLRQSNASLRVINMISDALYHSLDFDTVVKKAAKAMDDFFHAPSVSIFILNEKEHRLDQVFASDPDIEPARLIRTLPLKKGSITALTIDSKKIVICEDVSKDEIMRPDVRAAIIKWGRKTILSLPFLFHDQVLGAMNLFFEEKRTFTQNEQETFLSIGKTIGLALTNARHVSQLQEEIAERKKVESALRESEHKYRSIFKNTTEGIFQATPEGKIITSNPAMASTLGYDSPEGLITGIKDIGTDLFVKQETRQEFLKLIKKNGFVRDFEFMAYRKDRGIIAATMNVDTIRDENQNVLYFEGAFRDITDLKKYWEHMEELVRERTGELISANKKMRDEIAERKQTEEALRLSEEKYRLMFENAIQGMYQSTTDGRYLSVNPAFARMFGYATPEEMIHSVTDIAVQLYKNPEEREKLKEIIMQQGVIKNYEVERLRKDGQTFWQLLNAHLVRDSKGNILMAEGTCLDITDKKHAEEVLHKLNEELEARVSGRTAELMTSNKLLIAEIEQRNVIENALRIKERELETKTINLTEMNTALNVLLKHKDAIRSDIEKSIVTNTIEIISPYLEKLQARHLDPIQLTILDIIKKNMDEITSPFMQNLRRHNLNLTGRETEVANLIKEGKTSKKISELLGSTMATVDFHRLNIRRKLGIKNQSVNLRTILMSFTDYEE